MDKEVLEHVIFIREKISSIDQHLVTLNSKVAKNVRDIESNRIAGDKVHAEIDKRIDDIKLILAKWGAIATLFVSIVATVGPFIINHLFFS